MQIGALFFQSELQRRLVQFEKRLEDYIDMPDEENVHDIRTSLRRIDIMFSLLPKKERRSIRRRIADYDRFFKANSSLRDCDVIAARITALSSDSGPTVHHIRRRRGELMKKAVVRAKGLRKVGRIRISDASSEELQARVDKVVRRLSGRIKINLALAVSRNDVEQLHSLRKDCRKLRYVLESVSDSAIESNIRAFGLAANKAVLEELQNMLGDIHDSDMTLHYLKSSRAPAAKSLQKRELAKREILYDNFVHYVTSKLCQ